MHSLEGVLMVLIGLLKGYGVTLRLLEGEGNTSVLRIDVPLSADTLIRGIVEALDPEQGTSINGILPLLLTVETGAIDLEDIEDTFRDAGFVMAGDGSFRQGS